MLKASRKRIDIITLSQDNSEGLDDLQFNLGKIQVISKLISIALSSLPKDNSCCSQVLTNIVGAIAESARSHENRLGGTLSRKWNWTIPQFYFLNMDLVEKAREDYSPIFTFSTWVLLNVEKIREDNSPIFTFSTWTLWIVEKAKQDPCVSGS